MKQDRKPGLGPVIPEITSQDDERWPPASPSLEPTDPPLAITSQGDENCAPTTGGGTSAITSKGDKVDDKKPFHINGTEDG
jgi:hypothetical protein